MEEEIKGLLYTEILGHEICYTEFDNELVERLMQLSKFSASNNNNNGARQASTSVSELKP